MNFWFTIKEGLKGFRRARLATFLTISSITFSHFLIGTAVLVALNVDNWISTIRSRLEVEIFLENVVSQEDIDFVRSELQKRDDVESLRFVSKEDAARRFEQEFGKSVYEVLQVNPLPPSFIITPKAEARNAAAVNAMAGELAAIDAVDEVIYQKELIALIDRYLTIAYLAGALGIALISAVTIVLLYNTVRLTIFARRDIIEIMKLVGAKRSFIKRPFVVEGILQGLIGAGLACLLLAALNYGLSRTVFSSIVFREEIYAALTFLGVAIGFISSRLSVAKYLESLS